MKKYNKLTIFLKCVKIVKNWHVIPLAYYKFLKDEYFTLFLKNGKKINMRVNSSDFYAFVNVWVLKEYDDEQFKIKNNDIIIDIGAHIGLFTLYASQYCKEGRIYSFEPVMDNFELLTKNITDNNLKNVKIFHEAVIDKISTEKIFLNKDSAAHNIFDKSDKYEVVKTISLKEIFDSNNLSNCNLLKLDCEGSEYIILNSLPDSYFSKIEKIVMEYHMIENNLVNDLIKKLESLQFNVKTIQTTSDYGIMYVSKNKNMN